MTRSDLPFVAALTANLDAQLTGDYTSETADVTAAVAARATRSLLSAQWVIHDALTIALSLLRGWAEDTDRDPREMLQLLALRMADPTLGPAE